MAGRSGAEGGCPVTVQPWRVIAGHLVTEPLPADVSPGPAPALPEGWTQAESVWDACRKDFGRGAMVLAASLQELAPWTIHRDPVRVSELVHRRPPPAYPG